LLIKILLIKKDRLIINI